MGKGFKMICIPTRTPLSSGHGGGHFSSHAQGFASSSLANHLDNLLDSGIFPLPSPGWGDSTGSAPAALFPRQVPGGRIHPVILQLTTTSKWLQKKVTKPEAKSPRRWDASREELWPLLPDPAWGCERRIWVVSTPGKRQRNLLSAGQHHGQGIRLPGG